MASDMKDAAKRELVYEANKRVERMEQKMEDQLIEGGIIKALHEFTDDIATYPFAVLKGPAPRKRKAIKYGQNGMELTEETLDEYERVDPFKFYWAPWGDNIDEIPCIELHSLTRTDLQAMLGVEGYSDAVIRDLLLNFNDGGGTSWLHGEIDRSDVVTRQNHTGCVQKIRSTQFNCGTMCWAKSCLNGAWMLRISRTPRWLTPWSFG